MRSTSFSRVRRYSMRSAMVQSLRRCFLANFCNAGNRAIVPSSFMISQITAIARAPASVTRSTAASVWPARCNTPPVLGHEIDCLSRDMLRGHDEVALIFAVGIVHNDDHFSFADVGDDGLDGIKTALHKMPLSN